MPSKAVGWIASRHEGGEVHHYANIDGWQVDAVAFIDPPGEEMIREEASGYLRLLRALHRELAWWEEELCNTTGDGVTTAQKRIAEINKVLQGG